MAVVRAAAARLARAGIETPRLDAEILIGHALGVERERLLIGATEPLADGRVLAGIEALVGRRERREPVAYITGRRAFRYLELHVDRRVLIPRPETELLVEAALSLPQGARVVDVGTGSGAVALALKSERPDLEVIGTDISREALAVARENAATLRLAVALVHGDLLAGVTGPIDAVVANLPYVAAGDYLPPEVSEYEPRAALIAGEDGLDAVRRLVAALDGVPFVALEVGAGQAEAVAAMLHGAGFATVEPARDLAGHERVVVGCR